MGKKKDSSKTKAKRSVMSYRVKFSKLNHGDPLGEDDPAAGPDLTEGEEFESLRDYGMTAEKFWDKAKGEKFAEWLKKQTAADNKKRGKSKPKQRP